MEVSRPPPDRMLGRVLGDRYRVLSRLGEGGMGTVYLCEHAVLRRRFAVKILRPELCDDRELVERFRNEAIAASRIGQENVVDVLDFGAEEDGALYYVMEALEGRSLATVLRDEGPLAPGRALALLEQICRALSAAHLTGVVHRDVKPENVFIVRGGRGAATGEEAERAKVLDFGISHVPSERSGDRLTQAGAIIGTPEYMAPEQATGAGGDHRADVYAVGVMAYEILTGSLPIEAATPIATLLAAQMQAPEPPSRRRPGVPQQVDAVVLRALAKRPEDRFESMDALAAELARVRAELASGRERRNAAMTAHVSLPPRPSRPRGETVAIPGAASPRRRVALLAAAAGLGLAVALAAAGYWARGIIPVASPAPAALTATSTSISTSGEPGHPERSSDASPSERSRRAPTAISTFGEPGHPERSSDASASERSRRAATPNSTAAAPAARRPVPTIDADPDRPHATGLHEPYGASDLKPDPFE